MKDGICPKCGSSDVFKHESESVFIFLPWFRKTYPTNYVCADCGYFEWYIEGQNKLEFIRTRWNRVNPKQKHKNDY